MTDVIDEIRSAVIRCPLETPVVFGGWKITHREFALVGLRSASGVVGYAYCLTRDGPVKEIVDRTIAPQYVGSAADDPQSAFFKALWSNHSVHAAGIGMRALSVTDIAAWDLAARLAGQPLAEYLGGSGMRLPATSIVGYPPSMSPEATALQVTDLMDRGWNRFKLPISPDLDTTVRRLEAVRAVAPDAWIGVDANMIFHSSAEVIDFARQVEHLSLGWIEDIVPPGDAAMVRAARESSATPIAVGDEQGGSYYPEALLLRDAVDVLRVDATTDGGITRLRQIIPAVLAAGTRISPHMFPHVHARLLGGLGVSAPVEWGIPGTGVHPMDDPLDQPVVHDGLMEPPSDEPGLGRIIDLPWLGSVEVDDPDGVLEWVS
jgi:L-alanine-DL-glutamate epimerase-like enolase superfamily enzyme